MACRIRRAAFALMVGEEAGKIHLNGPVEIEQQDVIGPFEMVEVQGETARLHRKRIQSLVDEPEQARVIIRNLLRWAKEHGAK